MVCYWAAARAFTAYTCSEGKWKDELTTQEHTPVHPQRVMAGKIGTVGFGGTYTDAGATMNITALVGKRSIRYEALLNLLKAD